MFQAKPITRALAFAFGGLACAGVTVPALAQAPAPQTLERVEITGSNIKRIEGETATPVQVMTRDEIAKTGATTTEELLRTISAFDPGAVTVASNNAGANTGGLSTASLRGLGSQRTLVLINGRRIAPYGTVGDSASIDVNSIPLVAIERVEVLTQGASAIYGSDAIAGVVNFILRREYEGLGLNAEYGAAQGGGSNTIVSATYGFGNLAKNKFNVSLLANYQKQEAIYGADRGYASSAINEATNNDTTSGNTFPGNIAIPGVGSRNPLAGNCSVNTPTMVTSPFFGPNVCRFNTAPLVTLLPEQETWSIFAGGRYAISSNWEAFAEASYVHRDIFTQIQPVPLSDQFTLPPSNPLYNVFPYNITNPSSNVFLLNPSSPYYPGSYIASRGGDPTVPVLVRYRAWENGQRQTRDIAEQPRFTLGVTGTGGGWDLNAAYLYMKSTLTESTEGGFPQLTKMLPLLNSGFVNPFGFSNPLVQQQILGTNFNGETYKNETSLQSLTLVGSRSLMDLSGGPMGLALGGEWRKEGYNAQPSQLLIQGDVSGYGGNQAAVDVTRNVYALYGELSLPLLKTLEVNAAVRWDDYENVGSHWSPQVSARWNPVQNLLIRGAWSQGFRAPSLSDLYANQTQGVTLNGVSDPARCPTTNSSTDCATQFPILSGGNPNLEPETSNNYTIGFVFQPTNRISFGATAWWINIKDSILAGGVPAPIILATDASLAQFSSLVTRGPVQPAFPTIPGPITEINQLNINQGSTDVAGYDFDFKLTSEATEYGRWTFAFNGTYTYKYDITLPDGSVDKAAGTFSGNIGNGAGGPVPRWKQYVSLGWQLGPWNAVLNNKYQSQYDDVPGTFDDPSDPTFQVRKVAAYSVWSLQGSYTGLKAWTFTLGMRDIFDKTPPYTNAGGQFFFQSGYDVSYVNPLGRFLYGRVSYTFM